MKKAVYILTFGFLLPTILSCGCGFFSPVEGDMNFSQISIEAINTSGFNEVPVSGSIEKRHIGFNLVLLTEYIGGASKRFPSAFDCEPTLGVVIDRILNIKILVTDVDNNNVTDRSSSFLLNYWNHSPSSIDDFIRDNTKSLEETGSNHGYKFFTMEPIEYDFIPKKSIFSIVINLKSGENIEASTDIINFLD